MIEQVVQFDYPLYVLGAVGNNSLIVAGGGGAAKTAVPNKLEVVDVLRDTEKNISFGLEKRKFNDTGLEAVMIMKTFNLGNQVSIFTIEGLKCVEYNCFIKSDTKISSDSVFELENTRFLEPTEKNPALIIPHNNPTWELEKSNEFEPFQNKLTSGIPSCMEFGGPNNSWLVIGSDKGSVCLLNWFSKFNSNFSFCIFDSDLSDGKSIGLANLSLCSHQISSNTSSRSLNTTNYNSNSNRHSSSNSTFFCSSETTSLLMASLSDAPDWDKIKVWLIHQIPVPGSDDLLGEDNSILNFQMKRTLFTIATCVKPANGKDYLPSTVINEHLLTKLRIKDDLVYRFKHCQFLNYIHTNRKGSNYSLLLTTLEPLCLNRNSFSRLILFSVPTKFDCHANYPSEANYLTSVKLVKGHFPACIATHPSTKRALIAIGSLEGQVDVYFLSPVNLQLVHVYSCANAHPIFVTSILFLPYPVSTKNISNSQLTFELATVSVDRCLKLHKGPSYSLIGSVSHNLINKVKLPRNCSSLQLSCLIDFFADLFDSDNLVYYSILLLLPIIVSCLEAVLMTFL